MKNKKILIIFNLFFALFFVFLCPVIANAYGNNGHTGLTKEIVDLYNTIYDPDLTQSQIEFLIQGSYEEDTAPRWINHFYDPITGNEWLGKRFGNIPFTEVMMAAITAFNKEPVSALNWAHSQNLQTESYQLYGGNRTFESAVLFYSEGKENIAYNSLGHILHLIEDMAVPAHTRQDTHADLSSLDFFSRLFGKEFDRGEPYERWAESYTAKNSELNIAGKLKNNYTPICDSLDECLVSSAEYSNSGFFSQDSIFDKEYNSPKNNYVLEEKDEENNYIVSTYYSKDNYPLAKARINKDSKQVVKISLDYSDIHQVYWDNLSEQAVLAGVEVVKYFQDQTEKVKNKEITIEKPQNPNLLALLNSVSVYGEVARTGKLFGLAWGDLQAKVKEAGDELVLSVNDFYNRIISFNPAKEFEPPTFSIEDTIFSEETETIFSETIEPPPDFLPSDSDEPNIELLNDDMIRDTVKGIGGPIIELVNQFGRQEDLDDILEKIDIIRSEIEKIRKSSEANATGSGDSQNNQQNNNNQDDNQQEEEGSGNNNSVNNNSVNNNSVAIGDSSVSGSNSSGGGSISIPVVYSKILISEIQISGVTDEKEEFVELYNPNNEEIILTDWYLQRKTETGSSYSTFVSNNLFSGKRIGAMGYFLIARRGSNFESFADIITENSLGDSGSSSTLVFKNPNREISDKLGFGIPQEYEASPAQKPEKGKNLGRKWVLSTEQDTDNNSVDFEIQNSTPRARNITYVAPVIPPGPPVPPVADPIIPPPPTLTDTTAPQVIFTLNITQTKLIFPVNFDIIDPTGVVSPSGIDSYIFRWKEEAGAWHEDVLAKVLEGPTLQYSASREFTGEDEKTYYFQIKAKDIIGNESSWLSETPTETKISTPKKILINEIQVDGIVGAGGADDDWVELYNPNSIAVSLAGWSIQKHSKSDPCSINTSFYEKHFSDDNIIPANGFLLIVDTGAQESLKAIADITIGWSLSENNTIYLVKDQYKITDDSDIDIVDKVGFGLACFAEKEPALNPPPGQSIQRKWNAATLQHQDTDDNSADFEIQAPNPKTSYPKVNIEDATNHPNDMGSGLPGTIQYFLKIKWQGISSNISYYDAQYKKNDGSWQDWILQTTKTEEIMQTPYSLLTDNIYHFRARATDQDGNTGNWKEIEVNLINPVVINEVAYFGTNSSRDDQWIEFYNRSNSPVDLTGWKIISGISGYNDLNVELKGTIPAKGYFILEKKDDDIISDVSANQFYTGSFGKAYFYLYDSDNRYIDQVHIPFGGWSESDVLKEGNYYTIERISPYSFGLDPKNWRVNNGVIINGKDRDGGQIYGTPAMANSVYQIYTSHYLGFVEDTVLKKELSPYLFWGPSVSVLNDSTLTIEPGTVIKFLDAGLTIIGGTLKALGTPDQKIVFTSFLDDSDGRDTNGDADASLPNPGNWLGIYFTKESTGSELENVNIRYAGDYLGGDFGAGLRVDRASISLKNSVIEKNKNRALRLINSLSSIESSQFIDNNTANNPSAIAMAIQIEGSTPIIKNCYFEKNGIGVNIDYWYDSENSLEVRSFPVVENNTFKENFTAIWIGRLSHPSFAGNQMTNNSLNAPVFWGPIEEDTILKSDTPYIFRTNLTIPIGVTLTIEPGAIIKFINAGLIIDGTLKALGTPDQKIVFTSFVDDQYGGDTNGDADASLPNPGNWFSIQFTKNSVNSELENVVIRYAGDFSGNSFGAGLRVDQSNISFKNSILENNANNGLWLTNSFSIVDNIQFSGHIKPDYPKEPKAVYIQGGKPEVKNSRFQDNYYGVYMNKWTNPDTGLDVNSEAELHLIPLDPEANTFTGSLKLDIFDASIIP